MQRGLSNPHTGVKWYHVGRERVNDHLRAMTDPSPVCGEHMKGEETAEPIVCLSVVVGGGTEDFRSPPSRNLTADS